MAGLDQRGLIGRRHPHDPFTFAADFRYQLFRLHEATWSVRGLHPCIAGQSGEGVVTNL